MRSAHDVLSVGCAGEHTDVELGTLRQAQLDPGWTSITQGGVLVASAWRGVAGGVDTEFWVKKTTYNPGAARTLEGNGARTCPSWRRMACALSGATVYRASYSQSAFRCQSPPDPVVPAPGSSSFRASGSYRTTRGGAPFAWTYVAGNVEYWAMNHLIDMTADSDQAPRVPPYASFNQFISSVCATGTPPSEWFSAYYTAVPDFCAVDPC